MAAHILVVGGGIGGLASALALSQRGHRVDLFEQAPAFAEVGAGIQLGPNVTRRLHGLQLTGPLAAMAAEPQALVVRDAGNNAELARMPLAGSFRARYGAPYLCVHRADLHAVLLDAVRRQGRGVLSTDARITQIETSDDLTCVTATAMRASELCACEGDALVGADGLWSVVRGKVDASASAPLATGHTVWRGMVAQAALPAALRRDRVDVWLGPRLHAVAYPVRGGEWLNVVVIAEAAPAGDVRDWDQATSLAALVQATGQLGTALQSLLDAMPAWRAWTLIDRAPLASAAEMANGRVALVGDAAHPMVPYLAQGAGMAIEDAVALADAVGDGGAAALPAAFERYAAGRWQRNAQVQARARRNGRIFHATGAVRLGRDLSMRVGGARLLDQPWLYAG